jgi:hypothetical protein
MILLPAYLLAASVSATTFLFFYGAALFFVRTYRVVN